MIGQIQQILPQPCEKRLEIFFVTEVLNSARYNHNPNSEMLILQALKNIENVEDAVLRCTHRN
jgi:hypothetical protein